MAAVISPEALEDPIGVIAGLVARRDPAMDREVIVRVAESVAGGRAKRRQLAQALLDNPGVLGDGRSPAPRAVADLLIALRAAGSAGISPPACAECGKHLRTFQRRGDDWYCGVCGPVREPCAACGKLRPVNCRDRDGASRCAKCPPDAGRDPVSVIAGVVACADPSLPAATVAAAVASAVPRAGQRQRLAWALEDRPGLLSGEGAESPIPSVLRMIDVLCDAGAQAITRPACPGCGRVIDLHRPIGGKWLCRNCTARSRARPCFRCGAVREAATRDEHGQPICPACLVKDPVNQEDCIQCGRRLPVSVRTPGGPLCQNCRPLPVAACSSCGRQAPCETSMITGEPRCLRCQQRWAECSACGKTRPAYGGTLDSPLCLACTRPDISSWHACPACGEGQRIRPGRPCVRCTLRRKLAGLLDSGSGQVRPEFQSFHDSLAGVDRPATALRWLERQGDSSVLRQLAAGKRPLTHATLDELPDGKPLEHLRAMLVATGAIPPRDEQLARLERWITQTIAGIPDPDQRQVLHRYALWHVLRRLRSRLNGTHATAGQVTAAQRNVKAAIALLGWLAARSLALDSARQGDLDAWLAQAQPAHRTDAGNFARWACKHKLTTLDFPATRWGGPSGVIDAEARWEQARRLLHDDSLPAEERLAGLLVLLYAQQAATISRLTLSHVTSEEGQVLIRLGREPVTLPEPLGALALRLAATRRGHANLGDDGSSAWLFPGGRPGEPISAFQLTSRLRQIGIRSGQARSAALFQLATDLPAAVLARMLGIHITVAVQWQRASAGDWTGYAADVSRRTRALSPAELGRPSQPCQPRFPGLPPESTPASSGNDGSCSSACPPANSLPQPARSSITTWPAPPCACGASASPAATSTSSPRRSPPRSPARSRG
jgi:hypothetical protein